jgi:hypothetical protein
MAYGGMTELSPNEVKYAFAAASSSSRVLRWSRWSCLQRPRHLSIAPLCRTRLPRILHFRLPSVRPLRSHRCLHLRRYQRRALCHC